MSQNPIFSPPYFQHLAIQLSWDTGCGTSSKQFLSRFIKPFLIFFHLQEIIPLFFDHLLSNGHLTLRRYLPNSPVNRVDLIVQESPWSHFSSVGAWIDFDRLKLPRRVFPSTQIWSFLIPRLFFTSWVQSIKTLWKLSKSKIQKSLLNVSWEEIPLRELKNLWAIAL